jgi:ABC-type uncharacterized transport system permease subunit
MVVCFGSGFVLVLFHVNPIMALRHFFFSPLRFQVRFHEYVCSALTVAIFGHGSSFKIQADDR